MCILKPLVRPVICLTGLIEISPEGKSANYTHTEGLVTEGLSLVLRYLQCQMISPHWFSQMNDVVNVNSPIDD